jgi:hypothetical protein
MGRVFGVTRVLNSILCARKILYHDLIDVEVFCPGAHAAVVFILQRIPKPPLFVFSTSSDSVFFRNFSGTRLGLFKENEPQESCRARHVGPGELFIPLRRP